MKKYCWEVWFWNLWTDRERLREGRKRNDRELISSSCRGEKTEQRVPKGWVKNMEMKKEGVERQIKTARGWRLMVKEGWWWSVWSSSVCVCVGASISIHVCQLYHTEKDQINAHPDQITVSFVSCNSLQIQHHWNLNQTSELCPNLLCWKL